MLLKQTGDEDRPIQPSSEERLLTGKKKTNAGREEFREGFQLDSIKKDSTMILRGSLPQLDC